MRQAYFQERAAGRSKRERTRAALMDAAIEVVAEKGMEAAKISDMTAAAGLANGTFYNHFDSKDEILRAVAFGIVLEVGRQMDNDMVGIKDAPHRVISATAHFVSIVLERPHWGAVLLGSVEYMPDVPADMYRFMRNDIEMGVAQGKFDATVDGFTLEQIASLIATAMRVQLARGRDDEVTRRLCENIMRLLGMSPAKAARAVAAATVRRAA